MRLAWLTLALAACITFNGFAIAAEPIGKTRSLLLEVFINGYNQHLVVSVTERDGALLIPKPDLDEIGIRSAGAKADANGLIDVTQLSGLTAEINESAQTLILQARSGRLMPQLIDIRPPAAAFHHASSGTGLILDYDSVATKVNNSEGVTAGASYQATGFMPWGALTTTGFGTLGSGQNQLTRLDTALEIDDQDALRQWVIGDAISGGLNWSRAVRFAGLHVGTDYSLEPELVTQPLPQFFGQTTVPGTVDVFINAAKVLEAPIKPGPFEIRDLPVITGGGTAEIPVHSVLHDATPTHTGFDSLFI
jgi:outer membrane usher protein